MKTTYRVYLMTCTATGMSYVGCTCRPLKARMYSHRHDARYNERGCPELHRAIRQFGWAAFEVGVLATADNGKDARALEVQFIDTLNTMTPNGYNARRGR